MNTKENLRYRKVRNMSQEKIHFRREFEILTGIRTGAQTSTYILDDELDFFSEKLQRNIEKVPALYRYTPANYWDIRNFELSQIKPTPLSKLNDVFEGGEENPPVNTSIDFAYVKCFSESENNPLMWAHYADGSRGICVKYEPKILPEEERGCLNYLFPVLYVDNYAFPNDYNLIRSDMKAYKVASSDETNLICKEEYAFLQDIRARALIKGECWNYEKEWRLVVDILDMEQRYAEFEEKPKRKRLNINDEGIISFDCATAIYFGKRIELEKRKHLSQIVDCINLKREKDCRPQIVIKE